MNLTVKIIGICDSLHERADLIGLVLDTDEKIFIDPYVGCALREDTPEEELLGKTFEMNDFRCSDGTYIPTTFKRL